MRYVYLGDRMTRGDLVGRPCDPVRRPDGKCITMSLGKMVVVFDTGEVHVVLRRRLRVVDRGVVG